MFYHKHSQKKKMDRSLLKNVIMLLFCFLYVDCSMCPNGCSSHGKCGPNGCECYTSGIYSSGYGGGDCSLRLCPKGVPFGYLPPEKFNLAKDSLKYPRTITIKNIADSGPAYGKPIYSIYGVDYLVDPLYGYVMKCVDEREDKELTSEYAKMYNYDEKNKKYYIEFSFDIELGDNRVDNPKITDITCNPIRRYNDLSLLIINKVESGNKIILNNFKDILFNFQCKNGVEYNFLCEDNNIYSSECELIDKNIVFTLKERNNNYNKKCYLLSDYNGNSIPLEGSEVSEIMIYNRNQLNFPSSSSSRSIRMINNNNNNDIFLYLGSSSSDGFSIENDEISIDISSINNLPNENVIYNNLENGANIIIRELIRMNEMYTTIIKVTKNNENNKKILKIKVKDKIDSLKLRRILSSQTEVKPNHKNRLRGKAAATTTSTTNSNNNNNNNNRELDNTDKLYSINTFNINSIHIEVECSGQGKCNYKTGECECYSGYEGSNCNRIQCPNNCNGYGECVLLSTLLDNKELNNYDGYGNDRIYGCKCDRKRRGYDCSLIECPSAKDPDGDSNTNGLDYRDCSGRGVCDYKTGVCKCFDGYRGSACEIKNNFR